jgi:hypothetical protein
VTGGRSYGSPGAFRRALTDKLRNLATASRWTLQQLQRQMAYDRLLERLYLTREIAEADLRQAAALDIGDWFRFEIGPPRPLADTGGVRLPVKALVGMRCGPLFKSTSSEKISA